MPVAAFRLSSTRGLVALVLLLALGIGALFGRAIWTIRADEWNFARTVNATLVRTLEQSVARTLGGIDRTMIGMADNMAHAQALSLSSDMRARMLFDQSLRMSAIAGVAVLDAQGQTLVQLNPHQPELGGAERDYVAAHRRAADGRLFIGRPWKGADTDGYLLPLSRSYTDAQGRFAGVVVVALKLNHFVELLSLLELGGQSAANLFHADGTLLARFPHQSGNTGRSLAGTANLQRMQQAMQGEFTGTAALDGVERLYAFRQVAGYPLILNVAEATDTIFARWRTNAWVLGSFAALLVLACLGLAAMLLQELRRRQRLGAELYEAKHHLHTILDNLPSMVAYWSRDLQNRFANAAYQRWFGVTPEAMARTSLPDLLGPQVYANSWPYMQRALAGQRQVFERRAAGADGQERFSIVSYLPDLEEDGRTVRGVFVQATDITDHKRMEYELFEEKELMRLTLASIGDAVLCTDAEGHITYLNPVAERMTGWQAFDAAGRHIDEVAPLQLGGDAQLRTSPLCDALAQRRTLGPTRGVALQRRDGQSLCVQESASPITDQAGQVTGAVMVLHDTSETVALAERMAYLAHYDALTQLPNRLLLRDRLEQALTYARRSHASVAVMYLDLDGFKQVNDTLGHGVGDLLLVEFARRVVQAVRASDTVCRLGGDEFVVLLTGPSDMGHAAQVAGKILALCNTPFVLQGHSVQVGVSGGISMFPEHGEDFEALLRHADTAMYVSKRNGRGHFHLYTSARTPPVCIALAPAQQGPAPGAHHSEADADLDTGSGPDSDLDTLQLH